MKPLSPTESADASTRPPWNMRDLLEASAIPFATAEYAPRMAVFRQGDTSDEVLHIEDGRRRLKATKPGDVQ